MWSICGKCWAAWVCNLQISWKVDMFARPRKLLAIFCSALLLACGVAGAGTTGGGRGVGEGDAMSAKAVPVRGYLLHLTHYDPRWWKNKEKEKPFDLELGLEIIGAMAEVGMNLLVIDCADGVEYESHPELKRHYSVPMSTLEALVAAAREKGIEVVPKLNFSKSPIHRHNHWFRPHNMLPDNEEYWTKAYEIIDELISICKPERFFHIGMDEDHDRNNEQYIKVIKELQRGLKKRGLRTVIWNDSSYRTSHAKQSLVAEKAIPNNIVQVVWDYRNAKPHVVERLIEQGFEVWGAPGRDPDLVKKWRGVILGQGGKGLLMTMWIACIQDNREKLLNTIRESGSLY